MKVYVCKGCNNSMWDFKMVGQPPAAKTAYVCTNCGAKRENGVNAFLMDQNEARKLKIEKKLVI